MDLELLARACWRHRLRLVLCAIVLAVLLAGGSRLLIAPKYAASTDVAVFPASIDESVSQVYTQQPDRFVATQEAILASKASEAEVARSLDLAPETVAEMVSVAQVGKSDVLRVTATSEEAKLSTKVASALAQLYIDRVQERTNQGYAQAIASVEQQQASLTEQETIVRRQIGELGESVNDLEPLQRQLNEILSQETSLASRHQELEVNAKTQLDNTRVVSSSTDSSTPVGLPTATLALFGAALGMGLAACHVALTTGPGRDLEDLADQTEVDGIRVIGVTEPRNRWQETAPGSRRARSAQEVRNLAVAGELRSLIQAEGPLVVVPVGDEERVSLAMEQVNGTLSHAGEHDGVDAHVEGVVPLPSLVLWSDPEPPVVVLGVDTNASPRELGDAIAALRSVHARLLGIVGIR